MQSRNPVFNNSKAFKNGGYAAFNEAPPATAAQLQEMYSAPAATGVDTGRMTMDDVVVKTGLMFAVLLPLAAFNYWQQSPALTIGGVIVGLVLGLIVSFKQSTNATLILGYAAAEGLFLGGVSKAFEVRWPGIVPRLSSRPLRCSLSHCPTRAVACAPRPSSSALQVNAMGGYAYLLRRSTSS